MAASCKRPSGGGRPPALREDALAMWINRYPIVLNVNHKLQVEQCELCGEVAPKELGTDRVRDCRLKAREEFGAAIIDFGNDTLLAKFDGPEPQRDEHGKCDGCRVD